MLFKFKSQAAGDLIMLEANGRRVLEIIGKDPGPQGIILPEQMAAAMKALSDAVSQDEAAFKAAQEEAKAAGKAAPEREGVPLRQRVLPFQDMLKRCLEAQKNIVWGV